MLTPKRVKWRKVQRGRMTGRASRGSTLTFGEFGLQAMEPCWMTNRQIEAARIAMTRHIKRGGKVWIKVFPDKPVTKKPAEVRMGAGKGNPEFWVAVVRPGRSLRAFRRRAEVAKEALRLAASKLPIATKLVSREEAYGMKQGELNELRGLTVDGAQAKGARYQVGALQPALCASDRASDRFQQDSRRCAARTPRFRPSFPRSEWPRSSMEQHRR